MKHIPNTLSFLRLFLIIPLAILPPLGLAFMIIYCVAGLSDMIDGPIARRLNAATPFGAVLDGGADLLMGIVVIFRLLPVISISSFTLNWIFFAIFLKIIALFVGLVKFRKAATLHTYFGKGFGFLLFCFPMFYLFFEADDILFFMLIYATFTFVEDILILLLSSHLDLNHKGFFFKNKTGA